MNEVEHNTLKRLIYTWVLSPEGKAVFRSVGAARVAEGGDVGAAKKDVYDVLNEVVVELYQAPLPGQGRRP